MGAANEFAVTIHVVGTEGTVNNGIPVQDDGLVVEHGVVNCGEVLRDVQVCGESPDRAAHAIGATVVVELHSPEIVRVVPQVANRVAVGKVRGKAAVLRIDDGLRMTRLRMVGGAEEEAPARGIGGNVPAQGHATGLDAVGIVGRCRVESEGLNIRARHVLGIDCHLEVGSG